MSADARFMSETAQVAALAADRPGMSLLIALQRNPSETLVVGLLMLGIVGLLLIVLLLSLA